MKRFMKFLPFAALVLVFSLSSCNKDSISNKVAGEYVIGSDTQLTINEVLIKSDDYPQASIVLKSDGDNTISATLNNILLSDKEFPLIGFVEKTDGGTDNYSISLQGASEEIAVLAEGYVNGKKLVLNIDYELVEPLVGNWKFGVREDSLPDIYFNLSTSVETISFMGQELKISELVELANDQIRSNAVDLPVSSIEFSSTGFFNIHSEDEEMKEELKLLNNKIEFYTDQDDIYLYARKSLIDMINVLTAEYGINIPSPLQFALSYKIDGKNLNIELNKNNTVVYLTVIKNFMDGLTYEKAKEMLDLELSEEEYNMFKEAAGQVMNILLDSKTTYAFGANFVPAKELAQK